MRSAINQLEVCVLKEWTFTDLTNVVSFDYLYTLNWSYNDSAMSLLSTGPKNMIQATKLLLLLRSLDNFRQSLR